MNILLIGFLQEIVTKKSTSMENSIVSTTTKQLVRAKQTALTKMSSFSFSTESRTKKGNRQYSSTLPSYLFSIRSIFSSFAFFISFRINKKL